MRRPPWIVPLALLLLLGCQAENQSAPPTAPSADPAPLTRLTAEQYRRTVRDLFADLQTADLKFPNELEGPGGFENNALLNTPSAVLVDSYRSNAALIGNAIADRIGSAQLCPKSSTACLENYLLDVAQKMYRRPLTEEQQKRLKEDFKNWSSRYGAAGGLNLSLQLLLQSKDFLYFPKVPHKSNNSQEQEFPLDQWALASRLSYFLWGTMPDQELSKAAQKGQFHSSEALVAQARRMLKDPKAQQGIVDFHRQLFYFDAVGSQGVDLEYYRQALGQGAEEGDPADFYYGEFIPRVRYEPEVFVRQHVFFGKGTLEALLTSNRYFVTPMTAPIAYGIQAPEDQTTILWPPKPVRTFDDDIIQTPEDPEEPDDPEEPEEPEDGPSGQWNYVGVDLDPQKRAGLFTLASFLSTKTGPRQPSPVKRGVAILKRLQCVELKPPGDVPPLEDSTAGHAPRTNREKYDIHSRSAACGGCHLSIDGIGMTFENYDALGRWRDTDNNYPVDASGQLVGTDQDGPVNNWVEMAKKLAKSRTIHDCYAKQWFRFAFARDTSPEDLAVLKPIQESFYKSGNIQELLLSIVASHPFRMRRVQP